MSGSAVIGMLIGSAAIAVSAGFGQELTPTQRLWKDSFDAERAGNYKSALQYNTAIRKQADSYYANLRAGWLNYLLNSYDVAITFYSKASIMAPGAVTPLLGLSNCYVAKDDSANAIRATASVLAVDPTNYAANKRLAELYWLGGDFARASVYYLKLSTLYPEDLDIAASLAWSYLKLGRTYEARIIFDNVLVVNPDHASSKAGKQALEPKRPQADSP